MSTPAPTIGWRPLTRGDLTTFDDFMTNIVMEYTNLGWLGKMSKKGHAVLRAPDGENTTSVSRSSSRASSGTRARADLDRWKNSQPGASFGINANGYDAAADVHLTNILARAANDPRAKRYMTGLLEAGADPDDMAQRIAVIGNENQDGDWVLSDTLTRKVFAWSNDLTEDEAHVIAYGMLGIGETPEPEPVIEPDFAPGLPYRCDKCGKEFATGRGLGGHMNIHLDAVTCAKCGWTGKYIWSHSAKKHPGWDWMSEEAEPESTVLSPVQQEALAQAIEEQVTHGMAVTPSATLDPLDAVQALIEEVRTARVQSADFLDLSAQVTELRENLAAVTQQRDDLQARLDLLRETLAL